MTKNTGEIIKELELCEDFHTFYEENKPSLIAQDLSALLTELLEQKHLSKARVIKKAELSEVYGYQIFDGKRHPDRCKLLALAVGMELTPEETQTLLRRAGYPPLYAKLPFDSAVIFGLKRGLSVPEINEILFENDLETLG